MTRMVVAGLILVLWLPLAASAGEAGPGGEEKLRLGVVGLTHDHAWGIFRDLAKRTDVEVVGIAEKIPELQERARRVLARELAFYDDYQALLDKARPEAVMCFGDNREHVEVVRACAARKVHVMMEKPLAPTYQQARAAYEAARRAGIKLMVNYWIAWSPETYTAYERVRAGDVGRVWKVQVRFGHQGPIEIGVSKHFGEWLNSEERNGGGAIIDFGCYGADLLRWYLGKPTRVSAVTHTFKPQTYKVDDDAVIVADYPNAVGIVEASWNWPRSISEVAIFGDKASLLSERNSAQLIMGRERTPIELAPLPPERQNAVSFFVDAVRNNRPIEGLLSPEFNLDVAEILEAAKTSARTGRAATLPLP